MIEQYLLVIAYPVALSLFVVGSYMAFRQTKRKSALSLIIGFAMLFVGHLIKNYGPKDVAFTESGDAIISYSFLLNLGTYLGLIGIFVASVSFVLYVRGANAT